MPVFFKSIPAALTAAALLSAPAYTAAAEATAAIPRPAIPSSIPQGMAVDAKLASGLHFVLPAANPDILRMPLPDPTEITIAGEAVATEEQMLSYLLRRNPKPKLTGTPEELVHTYYEEAEHEGVRADVALAQAFKETGFFAYGGDVDWKQNNFCGLGATGGGAKGLSFPNIRTGARAHIQHLLAYSRTERPRVAIVDPRYDLIRTNRPDIYGQLTRWTQLNGVWAVPGKNYGQEILMIRDAAHAPDGSDASLHAANAHIMQAGDADNYIYRGLVYLHRAAYAEALADFTAAQKRNTKRSEPYLGIALAHTGAGNVKEARRTYEVYLKISPDDAAALHNYGLTLLAENSPAKAVAPLRDAIRRAPQNADSYSALAVTLIHTKDYAGAWKALTDGAAIAPANTDILINQILLQACLKDVGNKKK
ncbi:glucosaminidase domain-containing protein [uncultured Selenomonas sp.]|uniref:glucosaminidase domain-containing protein n=1 Tax=uncultured Selenomonas sp. TaxID=159275 RepID=UPI0028EC4120|nr:tetratricopeptide repeat protein [uncultured Selenomonas sp.]